MGQAGMSEAVNWATDGSDAAVIACLSRHLEQHVPKRMALPGGSTPSAILASEAAHALDWSSAEIWPTDERDVPVDHPASNFAMLARALQGTGAELFPLAAGLVPPAFDLVWLGVGMDGHIASIFPGMTLADDAPAEVVYALPDPLPFEAPYARLTLTMCALANAGEIILVIRGEAKKAMLKKALLPGSNLPVARFVRMAPRPVTIYWSVA